MLGASAEDGILPITAITDNKSLYDAVHSTKSMEDKRLRVDVSVLRDMLHRKEISDIVWTEANNQLADSFTKLGASSAKLVSFLTGEEKLEKLF